MAYGYAQLAVVGVISVLTLAALWLPKNGYSMYYHEDDSILK
jgi:hypothetical protein